ncbi:MAG: 1-deoxy-D-xylulose-5-phosphate reductoisomerase [Gemmatimonadetes bacterium]|nr:1-deoxy-D-xylulose-5-phosphate reductoisomerase [Gemmatimonadota bacterium]
MTKGVSILGSTGSIGQSTLRVLARHRDRFHVVALTALDSDGLLGEQARESGAAMARVINRTGPEGLIQAATHPDAGIVVNAVVGAAGLKATLAALHAGKRVALANKETLVMAGQLVLCAAREGGGEIVPIDSEHSAVLQCVTGRADRPALPAVPALLRRITLTASGGPFRDWPAERVRDASVEEALNHPTWRMGRKISIDSATLANKALEVIEAHHLFGLGYDDLGVIVHPQSIIHAFVEFVDGSVLSQLGFPNMELPILYALTHPERLADPGVARFDPVQAGPLTFEPVRARDFPLLTLGVEAGRKGGTAAAAFNAANEIAVEAFLMGRIRFGRIAEIVEGTLERHEITDAVTLDSVIEADRRAREDARRLCC